MVGDEQCAALVPAGAAATAELLPDFVAAIGHTSGSTGRPAAYAKTWGGFCATTALNAEAIRAVLPESAASLQPWIVATVPPQHMYGLEMTVLLPLLAGFGIHGGRPLMPADVAAALEQVPPPRVLVSTPVHLRTLVESGITFPDVAVVVSATAPLSQPLAQRIEQLMHTLLLEMFGSTETCVIATRRTARQGRWRTYPGIELESVQGGTLVCAPWLPREQLLHDIVELHDDRSFTVVGRHGDLVEIAGKRASLADLTRRLGSLPGVEDAVVFQAPAGREDEVRRCAALVVAPGLSAREIARRFRQQVDAAFVPRPLVVVPNLPRNELGKLPLNQLLRLLADARTR
jgi:acyl-coenzyme A synthetase/AMP-(fatty) acid ligase